MAVAKITWQTTEFLLINQYFKFGEDRQEHADKLKEITRNLQAPNVLFTGDVNGQHEEWFADKTDEEGEIVAEAFEECGLVVLNTEGQPHTFCDSRNRKTNVDGTASTRSLARRIVNWRVRKDVSSSDHRLLEFEPDQVMGVADPITWSFNYNTRKADWKKYVEKLKETREKYKVDQDDSPSVQARNIERWILEVAEALIPRTKKSRPRTAQWWTEGLERERKICRKAQRRRMRLEGNSES